MQSGFIKRICLNSNCNAEYELTQEEAKSDDGYCCFECWEESNCEAPDESLEQFEEMEILDLEID